MASKRVVQKRSKQKAQPVKAGIERAAKRAGIRSRLPGTAPGEWGFTGPQFDGGEDLRKDTSAADLFALVFDADSHSRAMIDGAVQCAIDDFGLIEYAAARANFDAPWLLSRFAYRAHLRLKVAIEVQRRMSAARGAAGGES
jgi:hypothetical protein